MCHKSIKDSVIKTVRYGKYRDRKRQATVKWLGEILHWASVFVKETAAQDITRFTLVITDVAACAGFAEINISNRHRVKMNA